MKFKKLISLCLLLAVLVVSFGGCEQKNDISEVPDISEDCPYKGPDDCCYSIVTNVDNPGCVVNSYNYGDEIPVYIYMQFSPSSPNEAPYYNTSVSVTIKESPSFEIIGDNTITNNLNGNYQDYICDFCIPGARNSIVFNFKIKVKEHTFSINKIKFETKIKGDIYVFNSKKDELEYRRTDEFEAVLEELMFITDSQGVIINSIPYSYNHRGSEDTYDYYKNIFMSPDRILAESYIREYRNGVNTEEIMDRHVQYLIGDAAAIRHDDIRKLKFKFWFIRIYETAYTIEYISKDVRFKMYLPERESTTRYMNADGILDLALSKGIITEDEYNIEKKRSAPNKQYIKSADFDVKIDFRYYGEYEIPNGDDYYHYVADLRTRTEKTKLVLKLGED